MNLLFDAIFSSVAFGHLMVDVINGQRPILLAYLSGKLGLTNTTLGLISTIYVLSASLLQPLFGFISDRLGARWVIAGGLLWMAAFYSLALAAPGNLALVLLVLASIGSGAYHPAATMQATMRGRSEFVGHEASAAAYFFVFGQLGYLFGPILAGPLLDHYGVNGLWIFALLAAVVGVTLVRRLRDKGSHNEAHEPVRSLPAAQGSLTLLSNTLNDFPNKRRQYLWTLLFPLVTVAALQSWLQQNMVTFIPKYLNDLGQSASHYGLIAALFMGGSAIGNIFGGHLADRFGKRLVIFLSLLISVVPLYLIPFSGLSAWLYVLIPLAGLFTGSVYSILVVLAQRIIPGGMALASGLILGFMFSSGAIGTYLSGYIADLWGLTLVFKLNALIALAAAIWAFKLGDS
jgi:FSR family fosmidomycin resistance protein-like MFS transporter